MESQKPKISFLIVNYKQDKSLLNLILSIPRNISFDYEILIFDNSSTLTPSLFSSNKVRLFTLEKNIGYGVAINFLATKAVNDYFIILNPDTRIVNNLDYAIEEYYNLSMDYGIYSLGIADRMYISPFVNLFVDKKRYSSYAFLLHKDLFKILGGFDINYFMYFEDEQYNLTLLKFGLKSYFPQKIFIAHFKEYKNITYKKRKSIYYKSLLIFLKKNYLLSYLIFFLPIKLLYYLNNEKD